MPAPAPPRLYLITPPVIDPPRFADVLAAALDAGDVGCVRLRLPSATETELTRAIEALRPICHARDVALVVSDYARLVPDAGLDGVHFETAGAFTAEARDIVGADAIIGVSCGASRHRGLVVGERGADYVAFGPVAAPSALHSGDLAAPELFGWWQEMIELPVVAEGGVTPETAARLVGLADFIALERDVWDHPGGPAAGVTAVADALSTTGSPVDGPASV